MGKVTGSTLIRQKANSSYASVHGALGAFSTNTQTYINASMEMAKARRGALRIKQWPHGFGFS